MNAMPVPLVFALALALGGRPWAGVWAALIVGFASTLPAYLANWGRYTQLAGQVVMLAALVCWINLIDFRLPIADFGSNKRQSKFQNLKSKISWRLLLLTSFVTAALVLTHYLVAALAALLIGSYLLGELLARRSWPVAGVLLLRAGLAGALALLLVVPWLLNII